MSKASGVSVDRLYRILDFSRAVQIFESESLYFAHPSTWEDPYETRVEHGRSHALFAQCWCQLGVSDAMWRIYSPAHMGVRLSTSAKKLSAALKAASKAHGYRWRGEPVEYLSQRDLNVKVREFSSSLKKDFNLSKAADILYLKREAFTHESEWRATIYYPDADPDLAPKGISVPVNPHELIENILLDPRAPQELVDAFTYYFKKKLKFKGGIERSVLYKSPSKIKIVD